ncbi:hypothetical protein [Brevibacillus formosus]
MKLSDYPAEKEGLLIVEDNDESHTKTFADHVVFHLNCISFAS